MPAWSSPGACVRLLRQPVPAAVCQFRHASMVHCHRRGEGEGAGLHRPPLPRTSAIPVAAAGPTDTSPRHSSACRGMSSSTRRDLRPPLAAGRALLYRKRPAVVGRHEPENRPHRLAPVPDLPAAGCVNVTGGNGTSADPGGYRSCEASRSLYVVPFDPAPASAEARACSAISMSIFHNPLPLTGFRRPFGLMPGGVGGQRPLTPGVSRHRRRP